MKCEVVKISISRIFQWIDVIISRGCGAYTQSNINPNVEKSSLQMEKDGDRSLETVMYFRWSVWSVPCIKCVTENYINKDCY